MIKYFLGVFLFLISCNKEQKKTSTNFYYWKTNYLLSQSEKELVFKKNVSKIYIRCFDISMNTNLAEPNGVLLWKEKPLKNIDYIPVVYIENEVFKNKINYELLAEKSMKLCWQIFKSQHLNLSEIQFDCDWTPTTQDNYFAFLKSIKEKNSNLIISNTLRMYQYKYPEKTGVPPTNYASLMCYNIGDMNNKTQKNSILNIADLKSYLNNAKKYPQDLNVALPIFNWNLLLGEDKKLKNINYKTPNFGNGKWVKISDSKYNCIENYFDENCKQYFEFNDEIRIENISNEILTEAKKIISQKNINTKNEIIYFDLDSGKIQILVP